MVGKKASADGSVMTSHTCDSWYRTWMQMTDAKDYPRDTVMSIYKGRMHTEYPGSLDGMKETGTIPQAKHTYRFLDTAYPCLNEKQLAMGETTFSGRDTLVNKNGMFMIEELQRVALERCTTAREAIQLMGKLIKEYGYADGGECLTIADPKEVWIFEVLGEGPDKIGGVWAAQRIPDDHIAVSANVSRIGKIDFKDKDNFMYSDNVKDVAKKLGLWDGKSEFSFWKAYSGGNYQKEEKNYSVRELFIMNELAPNAGLSAEMGELPVSIKPEKPVSVEDVSRLLASYYEGTDKNLSGKLKVKNSKKNIENGEPDSVVSVFANPWMRPDEIAVYEAMGDSTMHNIRTVSVSWCAYSHIIQCRDWLPDAVGGVAWVALDNPGQSPRFPIFAGNTDVPELLKVCGQHRERDDAALWRFREPNRLATVRWGQSRKFTEPARDHFLKKGKMEMPMVEQLYLNYVKDGNEEEGKEMLTEYSKDFFGATVNRWDDMKRRLWYQHWRGF
ncbi:MAG: C69 family dipeptidase [Muribaculaceae bacterium]|nr:C69 family dipeptidase [Muribaculaceae bacterium]MDE6009534.1 C69 family dipeptidase [Muribaculaceae bacterium]